MEYSLKFITITELEYKSEDELLHDIKDKMDFSCHDISLDLKPCADDVYQEFRVRYQRKNTGDCDAELSDDMYYVIPENNRFVVSISCEEDSFRKASFFQKVNNGKIRFGNNITLGKGRCEFFPVVKEEEISEKSLETGRVFTKDEYYNTKRTVYRELDDSYFVYHEKELDLSLIFNAHTDSGILIRYAQGKVDEKRYDGVVNKDDQPIVPASTWKGIFRNRISNYIKAQNGNTDIIDEMFGNKSKKIKGCLIFHDSIIINSRIINIKKAHINKFSSAFIGDLDNLNYVTGDLKVEIGCLSDISKYLPYLITVVRDLHLQRINVGADMGTGKGFIRIKDVTLQESNSKKGGLDTDEVNNYFKPIKEYLTKKYSGEEFITRLNKIERVEGRKCNVALIGSFGVGKSATINMLLRNDAAITSAEVTMDGCSSYKVNNFTFWDVQYSEFEGINTSYLLSEVNEVSNGLDLVVIITGSISIMTKDLFYLYEEAKTVINSERILFAINKIDQVAKDDVQTIIESLRNSILKKYGISVKPIVYSALSYKKDFNTVDQLQSVTDFWLMISDGLSKS